MKKLSFFQPRPVFVIRILRSQVNGVGNDKSQRKETICLKKSTLAREEKMNMIQEKLEAGTKEIFTTEKYKTYISTMAKFPEYSINNCILIASQCPTATLVCGYKKWQSEFHRTVNKNEHGIMIIAPVKYKADVEELVYDENSKPVLDEMGKQKKKIVNREFQSFRPAYVFDVQQTSGEPLPTLATMLEESVEGYEQLKEALILISPVQVSFESIEGSANGYYSPAEEKIVVREGMPQLQTIKTLIHEIGHVELKHGSEEDKFDRNTKEIQAESVAFWVAERLEMDLILPNILLDIFQGGARIKQCLN